MPRRFEMSDLVSRCQKRCDLEGSSNISPTEWQELISEQYGELYAAVADAGLRYFETVATITTTGATSYSEPADHLGTVLVARVNTSGGRRDLREIPAQERQRWMGQTGDAVRFALVDDQIFLYPVPPAGQTYEILYVPQPPNLSAYLGTDAVDVVVPAGESFLIWGVAVKALAKGSSPDIQTAIAERNEAKANLMTWATERALLQPRVKVVQQEDEYDCGWRDPDWTSYR